MKTIGKLTLAIALAVSSIGPALADGGSAQAALSKNSMCIGCHGIPGYKASFPEVYSVPYIAGQSAAYLEAALKAYRKGDRDHPSMVGIAKSLSDQDIADLAAYYSQAQ